MDTFPPYTQAREVAGLLLDSGCIKFAGETPFTLTSGRLSPVYVNMRAVLGPVSLRQQLMAHAATALRAATDMRAIEVIAGGETAGIGYAALLAELIGCDFAYVRKAPKGFGLGGQIEGAEVAGRRVLLAEDLTTDGGSKAVFTRSLREAGAEVSLIFSAFWYGLEAETRAILAPAGLSLCALCTWREILDMATERAALTSAQVENVKSFLAAPEDWQHLS